MKRMGILVAAFLGIATLAATSAEAAPPFGSFGGRVGGGNAAAGVVPIHGWALDDNGIAAVDILVDGVVVGRSDYGRARPQVARRFPGFPDSARAGFGFQLDTTRFLNGIHRVQPRALSRTGETTLLNAMNFHFNNVTHDLIPFGDIEFPQANAELAGRCNPLSTQRRYQVVWGWALDAGVQADDHGVGYVELQIDRAVFSNSLEDCFFSSMLGGLTQCFGLRRIDIERRHPGLRDSPHAGFRFVLDIGRLMELGYGPGFHTLTVRVGDQFGQVVNVDEIPVTFTCDDDIPNEASFGFLGTPDEGFIYSGLFESQGWALDREGIREIHVFIDGIFRGFAVLGGARPSVPLLHPGFPESANAGWTFGVDTTQLANGRHSLLIVAVDTAGVTTLVGERDFLVRN